MEYYKDLAEMYVGDDVSPDFYGWVFPKYDHVAVGTGTVVNKTAIKQYQQATRDRSKARPTTHTGNAARQRLHGSARRSEDKVCAIFDETVVKLYHEAMQLRCIPACS